VADLTSGVILASVEIAAAPERVFRAICSEEIASWWGSPYTFGVTRGRGFVRPGGWGLRAGVSPAGPTFAVSGDILEVEPPTLLVQTWRYEHKPGDVTTVRFRIEAIDGGSRITVRHSGFTNRAACESHERGWERVLRLLAGFLAS
jgi:uncharacterized protein YndB with AHSA1/START domain